MLSQNTIELVIPGDRFFSGFEKRADKNKDKIGRGGTALKGLGTALGVGIAANLGAVGAAHAIKDSKGEDLRTLVRSARAGNENLRATKVQFKPFGSRVKPLSSMYIPKGIMGADPVIHSAPNLGILAHELGHAAGPLNSKPGLIAYALSKNLHGIGAISAPITAANAKSEGVQNAAIAAPMVMAAPMLAEEARATVSGMNMIRKSLGIRKALSSSLGPAAGFASYLAVPAAASGASYWAKKRVNKAKAEGNLR